ncbi:hypothetical protein [Eubacterium sp. 1001713B170207_170306_E7]|uniref:hypothetical protein n=1 Tax=Eubacterium sp. 1001713B170207_170306_E7 TaxID=2787097 RepID=UPI001899A610|nr:hypothetical protein [Eubacterium sp. 1001713B170207_170306_E7]
MPVQIDMEMPKSCLDCRFCIEESSGGANYILNEMILISLAMFGGRTAPVWMYSDVLA